MYINLWLVASMILHQHWVLCYELIDEVTQKQHNAFILVFLLVHSVDELLVLAQDLI